jgi:hypothetical protein
MQSAYRGFAALVLATVFGSPAIAQSARPAPSPEQKDCTAKGQKYVDDLHDKGASFFGAHYDPLSKVCEAEYVVISKGLTRLSIDDISRRQPMALYVYAEKTDKVLKCYVLSTRCYSEGGFLDLSHQVLRWVTF